MNTPINPHRVHSILHRMPSKETFLYPKSHQPSETVTTQNRPSSILVQKTHLREEPVHPLKEK